MLKLFKHFKVNKVLLISLIIIIGLKTMGILYIPTLIADIVNNGVIKGDIHYVLKTGGVMITIALFTGICAILSTYFSAEVSTSLAREMRSRVFSHAQKLSLQDFKHFSTSSLITRCTSDVNQIENTVHMALEMIIPVPFIVTIGMFLAFSKDPYMAFIILLSGIAVLIFSVIISKKVIALSLNIQFQLDKINSKVRQFITGIRIIRAFNKEKYEKKIMNEVFATYANTNIKINKIFAMAMPVIIIIMNISAVSILWIGSKRVEGGHMLVGDIMAIIEYSIIILFYLVMAMMVLINIPRANACINRILEVVKYSPEIVDEKVTVIKPDNIESLEFKNVTFSYKDAQEPVLKDLNFICKKGKNTAIIGATGSGKSTVAKLISRLHEVQDGEILINNNTNIKEFSQNALRDMVSLSPQKAFLFSGTIAENLRHGTNNATIVELIYAAKIAQADDFILSKKLGYDSVVSQGGSNFSGGQKQRLCIARALVKKSYIYIFDDSFSALDYKTDAKVRAAMKEELKDSIIITISQRISTIIDADQIIVLDEGSIVGIGTHEELLRTCPIYLKIAETQLSKEELV